MFPLKKKSFFNIVTIFLVTLGILGIIWRWFLPGVISSGDLWPVIGNNISASSLIPYAWSSVFGGGLGGNSLPYLWNHFQYISPIVIGKTIGLSWNQIVRIGYLFPIILLSAYSSFVLAKRFIKPPLVYLSVFIYTINTYSILVISGGQTGVSLGYAFFPYVLSAFIPLIEINKINYKTLIRHGFQVALFIIFDLRLSIIGFIVETLYALCILGIRDFLKISTAKKIILPWILAFSFHLYWILPTIIYRDSVLGLGEAYTNPGMLNFLSFADFSHAIAFLHPNWPENLFGKVYFIQFEFLFIPLIAFSVLFFRKFVAESFLFKRTVYFFALLALGGAFFAKGTQEPFGSIYVWMFTHIPGFILFRDPTKFYMIIAISYALLIPFSISYVFRILRNKPFQFIVMLCFYLFWILLMRDAYTGDIKGVLHRTTIPSDYILFNEKQTESPDFYRTLWLPTYHRFSYPTTAHPAIDGLIFLREASSSGIETWFKELNRQELLANWSVKYVVVPIDTDGTIFQTDRIYDDEKRNSLIQTLDLIPYLKRLKEFNKLAVWQTTYNNFHLWTSTNQNIQSTAVNPTEVYIQHQTFQKGEKIYFSERFSPHWTLTINDKVIKPTKTINGIQMYTMSEDYSGLTKIMYAPQQTVYIGLVLSGIIILISLLILCL